MVSEWKKKKKRKKFEMPFKDNKSMKISNKKLVYYFEKKVYKKIKKWIKKVKKKVKEKSKKRTT